MVTLDSSDIFQYQLIEQLLVNGLEIARINCAHNTKREWKLLIESIRSAEERLVQHGRGIGHNIFNGPRRSKDSDRSYGA